MQTKTRARVARLHRWLAVALMPVILLIVASGAVLAFRPILGAPGDQPTAHPTGPDTTRLLALVAQAEARGEVDVLALPDDGRTAVLVGPHGPQAYTILTGAPAPMPRDKADEPHRLSLFEIAERVHRDLWFGLGGLVTLGSLAMIFLVIAGPLLARPSRGGGPLGRHIRGGWLLWPLVAMLPLSLVAMKLHPPIGRPGGGPRRSLAELVRAVASRTDLARVDVIQRMPGGNAFVVVEGDHGPEREVLRGAVLRPMETTVSRVGRAIHEGTWAGPWSGALNVIAALATLWVMATGLVSWLRHVQRDRARRARVTPLQRAA